MSYVFEKRQYRTAYMGLYELIKEDIVDGVYPYGGKLPSKRVLAVETGFSVITVGTAYDLLCDEGYIEGRERSGYYVIFRKEDGFAKNVPARFSGMEQMTERMDDGKEMTESADGSMAFPYSVLAKTMRRVMSDYAEAVLDPSPNIGRAELRDAIKQYLSRNRDIHVDSSQIVIGSGAEYLYNLIVGLLGSGKIYALESPSYDKIEKVYNKAGALCDLLPLGPDGIESSALTRTKAEVLHVSPYRTFPTGITATASKRHEYIRWAKTGGRYIVEDDFESEFSVLSKPEETLFALSEDNNVIYINTFSRTISSSLRVGYMVLPRHLAEKFQKELGFYSSTVPTFEQLVLAYLISGGDFERHINRVRRNKRKSHGDGSH